MVEDICITETHKHTYDKYFYYITNVLIMKSIRKEISRTKAYDRFIVGNLTCGTKRHREEKFRASRN